MSLSACSASAPEPDAAVRSDAHTPEVDAGPPWAGWPACDPAATTQRLTFVHVNDLHASYGLRSDGTSPWARVRHFYERTRQDSPYTIFTDGGDDHEKGSVAELLSEGRSTIDLVRAMEFDVRVLGNHDFAWSLDELLEFTIDPHAVVLSANHHPIGVDASRWHAEEVRVLQIGCLRVGFSGLTSMPWDERDQTIVEPFYPELSATYDYVAEARRVIDAHADEADLWVFVDHIGQSEDEALASAVPEIDLVLSGHSHTFTPSPVSAGHAVVVQSGSSAQFVLRLDLDVDLATHAVTVVDYEPRLVGIEPPSPTVQAAVERALEMYAPEAATIVGTLVQPQNDVGIAEIAARAAIDQYGADAALVDVRTVWTSWVAGGVDAQMLANAFKVERERAGSPGFSSFYRVAVSGADLIAISALHGGRFRYAGLAAPDAAATYSLVVQKRVAFHPDEQLDPSITFPGTPEPLAEVWATLDAYARSRTAACLAMDVDQPLPSCAP